MTLIRGGSAPRRMPVPADRYRHAARSARDKRRRRVGALAPLGWAAIGLAAAIVLPVTVTSAVASFGELAGSIGTLIAAGAPAEPQPLVITDSASTTAGAEPVLDGLPDYTRETRVLVQGHVPAFAVRGDRRLEVLVNGEGAAFVPIDAQSRFAAEVTLRDGPNAIVARLVQGRDTIALTSRTLIVDRAPPSLTIVRPRAGDVIEGATVTVEGKTEPRLQVRVNERTETVAADGTFAESFTAAEGALSVRVVARDQAGNETLLTIPVTIHPAAKPAGLALRIALDRSVVRPGEAVVADISLTDGGAAKPGVTVSLSVGVIAIGSARTDDAGRARLGFAAPPNEGAASVVVLAPGATGSAVLSVAR